MPVTFESGSSSRSYARNPRVVLWGDDQTSRAQHPQFGNASRAANDATIFLQWKVGETMFGASESWVDIQYAVTPSSPVYSDLDIKPNGALFDGIFSLLPGLWKFSLMSKSIRSGADNDQVRIFKVVAGDTDELIAESTAGILSECGLGLDHYYVSGIQKTPPVEVDGETTLSDGTLVPAPYFYVINGDDDTLGQHSHYMELEYLGPA